jgi:hypothetical protein
MMGIQSVLFWGILLIPLVLLCTILFTMLFFKRHEVLINIENKYTKNLIKWSIYVLIVFVFTSILTVIGMRFLFGIFAIPIFIVLDVYAFKKLKEMTWEKNPKKTKRIRPIDSSYTGIR